MQKNKVILTLLLILSMIVWGTYFMIYSYKAHQLKIKNQQDKEIANKLENMEIKPEINLWNQNANSWSSDNKEQKTTQDIMKEEEIAILSFTNIRQCEKLKYYKDDCKNKFLFSLATNNDNLEYCNRLTEPSKIVDCKDEIYYKQNSCSSITNGFLKKKCEYNIELAKKSTQQEDLLKKALSSTNTDLNLCNSLDWFTNKEECVKNIALQKKDVNVCNIIFKSKDEQQKCVANISYELNRSIIREAFEKKDLSLCDKLTTQQLRTQCKSMTF